MLHYWITLIIVSLLCLFPLTSFYNLDAPSQRSGERKAERLISALTQYKQDNRLYPHSMDNLIPNYVKRIPRAGWQYNYCYYRRDDGQSFTLAFIPRGEVDGWHVYSSKLGRWVTTDSEYYLSPCQFFFDE